MTTPIILTTLICLGLSIGSAVTSGLQQSQEASDLARRVAQLPLEPSYILPSNLGEMVSMAQAANAKLPDGRNLLQQQWLGSSVAMNKTAAGAVPQWLGLVAEVKRLSASAKQ